MRVLYRVLLFAQAGCGTTFESLSKITKHFLCIHSCACVPLPNYSFIQAVLVTLGVSWCSGKVQRPGSFLLSKVYVLSVTVARELPGQKRDRRSSQGGIRSSRDPGVSFACAYTCILCLTVSAPSCVGKRAV